MRVLVTGVSGLIGSNIAAAAAQQSWDVLGGWRDAPVQIGGVRTFRFDMADRRACVRAALEFEPDVIVHAAGGVALSRFERDPWISQLDFVGTEHTLAAARAVRARYVLVSCDWVHSGYRPPGLSFSESDTPEPVNAYGRSKLACEQATMRSNVNWLITRVGEPYGVNMSIPVDSNGGGHHRAGILGAGLHGAGLHGAGLHGAGILAAGTRGAGNHNGADPRALSRHLWRRSGLALGLVRRLRDRTPVPAPAGFHRSPTYAWDYAQRTCELIAQGCEGVYNTAGPQGMGRREWIELLSGCFHCSDGLVREGTRAAFLHACGEDVTLKLPPNTALSDEKCSAAIGAPPVAPREGARLMCDQLRKALDGAGRNLAA